MGEPLHLKYRPKTFDEFIGNDETVEALISLLESDSPPKAFLFYGPSGCGKTTLARIVAKELGCKSFGIQEYNVADVRGIDTIREIIGIAQVKPLVGSGKAFILDEVHKLTNDAQNALLKILEEPPSYCYFILCSTEPERLLPTIRNRCTSFKVSRLSFDEVKGLIEGVLRKEGKKISLKVLRRLIQSSEGSPRKALVLLGKVLEMEDEDLMLEALAEPGEDNEVIVVVMRILLDSKLPPAQKWSKIRKRLNKGDWEPEGLRRGMIAYCNKVLLGTDEQDKISQILGIVETLLSVDSLGIVAGICSLCFS